VSTDMETEVFHAAIRMAVEEKIQNDGTYTAIGPVEQTPDGTITCILEIGDISKNKVDNKVEFAVFSRNLTVNLIVKEAPPYRFSACYGEVYPVPPPNDDPTPEIRGGQACWNDSTAADWGSIAIAAKRITIRQPGINPKTIDKPNGACLSVGHVLYSANGNSVSSNGLAQSMTYYDRMPMTGGGVLIDAAIASVNDMSDLASGRIIGFGKFNTNRVAKPTTDEWIASSGAKSGITMGFDRGAFNPYINGIQFLGVRKTTPGFSCCHDSGAPVINSNRMLVGVVFAGQDQMTCEQRPHAIYLPLRPWSAPEVSGVWDLEIDIRN
jgi:hypothetical protein